MSTAMPLYHEGLSINLDERPMANNQLVSIHQSFMRAGHLLPLGQSEG